MDSANEVYGKPVTPVTSAPATKDCGMEHRIEQSFCRQLEQHSDIVSNQLRTQSDNVKHMLSRQAEELTQLFAEKVEEAMKKSLCSAIILGIEISEMSPKQMRDKVYELRNSDDGTDHEIGRAIAAVAASKARDEARRFESMFK